MSFDNSNRINRTVEQEEALRAERRKKMMFGSSSPSPTLINPMTFNVSAGDTQLVISESPSDDMIFVNNKVYMISANLIDEHPENIEMFSMDDIDAFAKDIDKVGFYGVIVCRFKRKERRFEIIAGHRRFRGLRKNDTEMIPCIVINNMDDRDTLIFLLKDNINNRKWKPLDYARAIKLYMDKIQPYESYQGRSRDDVADFFHISATMVHRYCGILKLIPELTNDSSYPFTAITSASTMSEEEQKILYEKIMEFVNGNPSSPVTRRLIESLIKKIRNGTDNQKVAPKAVYVDDYIYKVRTQLSKINKGEKVVKDKEQTLAYIHDLEALIDEIKSKL
mgnify:FL=1